MVFTLTYGLANAAAEEVSKGKSIASAQILTNHFICKYEIKDEHFPSIYAAMQKFRRKRLSRAKIPDNSVILLEIEDANIVNDAYNDDIIIHENDQLFVNEVEVADEFDTNSSCYRTSLLDLKRHAR